MLTVQELKKADWLYQYKKKIIVGILLVLTLTVALTMVFIAVTLRSRLIDDSKAKTHELSDVIRLSLSHLMLVRNPGSIQSTLESIGTGESTVVRAFILDKNGKIIYSSHKSEIGTRIDRFQERSCTGCHTGPVTIPHETTMIIRIDGQDVLRNVSIINNEQKCHACHSPSDRINGKLIIDRSIQPTFHLIARVGFMLAASGVICLIILVPFLSRMLSKGVDKYIDEILLKSTELSLLYQIVERLSKSIEIEELKYIVVEVVREVFGADSVEIVLPKEGQEYSGIVWNRIDNKIDRRMAGDDDPYRAVISSWLKGELNEERISSDNREIFMPIIKNDNRLALIIIRKTSGTFSVSGMGLVKAMSSHIAVAFDNAALYQIAITDELTGLYSKRHFWNSIEKKFALFEQYGEKLTLLLIDIDDFKKVNDTHGHPVGDLVLKKVSQCILQSTRDEDIDFRYGGEEFAVLLPASKSSAGRFVAERIRKKIEETIFTADELELRLTVSVGVASCPEHAQTIKDLIVESDKALYVAKRSGKNRVALSSAQAAN